MAVLILGTVEVERGQLLEAGTYGLSREFRLVGVLACPARVVAWPAVETIVTRWRRPDDYTVLETIVSGGGTSICFSTHMGYAPFRALVTDVVAHAPAARRVGLTDELLREPWPARPGRRHLALLLGLALLGALLL